MPKPAVRQSMLAYNLPKPGRHGGNLDGLAGHRVTVQAERPDPALLACSQLYNPGIADPALSATGVDINQAGHRLIGYSGVLAIRPVVLPPDPHDEILFGGCRTGAPRTVSLRAFRYSIYNR